VVGHQHILLVAISACSCDFSAFDAHYLERTEARGRRRETLAKDVEVCNVLWIGCDGDIAYRKAVGIIYLDVWERWNPESATIILC
jgi:hypothetical protein